MIRTARWPMNPFRTPLPPRARRLVLAILSTGCVTFPPTAEAQGAAQAARPPAPVPGLARATADSGTTSYEVAGIRVIHRFVTANEVVAANVYLLGGTRQLTPSNAGIEQLLLEV